MDFLSFCLFFWCVFGAFFGLLSLMIAEEWPRTRNKRALFCLIAGPVFFGVSVLFLLGARLFVLVYKEEDE